jgi:hypothetical protein
VPRCLRRSSSEGGDAHQLQYPGLVQAKCADIRIGERHAPAERQGQGSAVLERQEELNFIRTDHAHEIALKVFGVAKAFRRDFIKAVQSRWKLGAARALRQHVEGIEYVQLPHVGVEQSGPPAAATPILRYPEGNGISTRSLSQRRGHATEPDCLVG